MTIARYWLCFSVVMTATALAASGIDRLQLSVNAVFGWFGFLLLTPEDKEG